MNPNPLSGFLPVSSSAARRRRFPALSACLLACLTACSASEGFVRGGESHGGSLLSGNNYRAVKMGAVGRSSGFSLFGFIPLWSPTFMEANQDLLANVGSDLTGRGR